jgi:uncharacterized damage-inducible protein DinB
MTTTESRPEVWLRGPVEGVPPELQPVAHALIQAHEEVEAAVAGVDSALLWRSVNGAATIGFHLRHMTGSMDRLFTYARGERLSPDQRSALGLEREATIDVNAAELIELLRQQIDRAMAQLRSTDVATLDDARQVGRSALPSTVRGLLHHAGEHSARHAGQVVTSVRLLA